MSDVSDSGERKGTIVQRISEKTHISLRTAAIVVLIAIIPLTVYLIKLSASQTASDVKAETTHQELNQKIDATTQALNTKIDNNAKEVTSKIDGLIAVLKERETRRDEELKEISKKLDDHEVRIRIVERVK